VLPSFSRGDLRRVRHPFAHEGRVHPDRLAAEIIQFAIETGRAVIDTLRYDKRAEEQSSP
jgi:hypothetical protein